MASFSKMHHLEVARILSSYQDSIRDKYRVEYDSKDYIRLVQDFIDLFQEDNINFDRLKFLKACDLENWS